MAETLYAAFADPALAEKAAGALLDYGMRAEDISLVTPDEEARRERMAGSISVTGPEDAATADAPAAATTERVEESDESARAALNRAARADEVAGHYETAAEERASAAGMHTPNAPLNPQTHVTPAIDTPRGDDTDLSAKHGLSTTTPADAGSGAAKGAGIGLGLGVLGLLASLIVPGVGLVVGGGALATAIGAAIGTTAAGAVAGGVFGYLKDQGMPEHLAADYQKIHEAGGAILAIQVPSGEVDRATAEHLLSKYGAENVNAFGYRQAA